MNWFWADDTYRAWSEWRKKREEAKRQTLNAWISRHPDNVLVALASSVEESQMQINHFVMDSFIDLLRTGQGIGRGGWGGFAEDGLRFLSCAGPIGKGVSKIAQVSKSARFFNLRLDRVKQVVNDPLNEGGVCTWIATAQALQMAGVRHYVRVSDLLKFAGKLPNQIREGTYVTEMVPVLQEIGATVRFVSRAIKTGEGAKSMDEVAAYLKQNPDGVMMFSVQWGEKAHSLIAMFHPTRGLMIADRYGDVVKNLTQLEHHYPGISTGSLREAMVYVEKARWVKHVETVNEAPYLGILSLLVLELKALVVVPDEVEPVPIGNKQGTYDKRHRAYH